MHIATDFVFKRLEEAQVGELVVMPLGTGSALAMVLATLKDGLTHYGILTAPEEFGGKPFHSVFEAQDRCLSFGLDWELELIRSSETSAMATVTDVPGAVNVTYSATIMNFAKPPKVTGAQSLRFDLRAWASTSTHQPYSAPVMKWKIWRTRGMSLNTKAKPIAAFDLATATQASLSES